MKRSNLTVALSLVIVFASGVVVGVVGDRYVAGSQRTVQKSPRTPEEFRRAYVEEMSKRLKLTPEQLGKLNVILDETRERFRQLREKQRPEVKALQDAQTEKIHAILNAEQREEYDRMRKEREEKRRREDKERGR